MVIHPALQHEEQGPILPESRPGLRTGKPVGDAVHLQSHGRRSPKISNTH